MNQGLLKNTMPRLRARRNSMRWVLFACIGAFLALQAMASAHAFGDVAHVVQDECQIFHHVDRQGKLLVATSLPATSDASFERPIGSNWLPVELAVERSYRSRAPPLA